MSTMTTTIVIRLVIAGGAPDALRAAKRALDEGFLQDSINTPDGYDPDTSVSLLSAVVEIAPQFGEGC